VHQDIHLPEGLGGFLRCRLDLGVLSYVAGFYERAANACSQRAHAPFQDFTSVAQTDGGALFVKGFGNPPGDRALVAVKTNAVFL
jgi:hypothetical protein